LERITSPVFEVKKEIPATSGDSMERGGEARAAAASLPVSRAVYALAIAAVALHMAFSGRYGYFRDELYYAACGQRLAWAMSTTRLSLRFSPALAVRSWAIRSQPCVYCQR